jgi:ceramide glucosyltransferase
MLAATINHDLLGYFSLQAVWTGLRVANGSCVALRRDTLEAIGGLAPLGRSLLMDSLLARTVRRYGYRVHLHTDPAPIVRRHVSVREWWDQAHRWQVAMSQVLSPTTYAGFCWMRSGFGVALACLVLHGFGWTWAVAITGSLGSRLFSAALFGRFYIRDTSQRRFLWLLPVVELVNAVGCLYALLDRRVTWRGVRFSIGAHGIRKTPLP